MAVAPFTLSVNDYSYLAYLLSLYLKVIVNMSHLRAFLQLVICFFACLSRLFGLPFSSIGISNLLPNPLETQVKAEKGHHEDDVG